MTNEKRNPNSARGLVTVARTLADTVHIPLTTHRMRKLPALLVINAILNRDRVRMEQRTGDANGVVIRMGGAR